MAGLSEGTRCRICCGHDSCLGELFTSCCALTEMPTYLSLCLELT
jgi:hypothetical protein